MRGSLEAKEATIQTLEQKLEHMNALCSSIDFEAVRRVQDTAFQNVEDPDWKQDADEELVREVEDMSQSLRSWIRAYARKEALDYALFPDQELRRLKGVFEHFSVFSKTFGASARKKLGTKQPAVLLTALINYYLFSIVFGDPLFFEPSGEYRTDLGQMPVPKRSWVLRQLYDKMRSGDEKTANDWLLQTLRGLRPSLCAAKAATAEASHRIARLRDSTIQSQRQAARGFCHLLLRDVARFFISPQDSDALAECQRELEDIVARAAAFSYRVAAQKTKLEVISLSGLPKDSSGRVIFSSNSEYMEHHPLHNVMIDEDAHSLDGKEVLLVTQPAVLARGFQHGQDPSKLRVLKEAVVWMGS